MALLLTCDEQGWSIPLEIDSAVGSLLALKKQHADEAGRSKAFIELLSRDLLAALKGTVGADLRLPTTFQVDLAVVIARQLAVDIPSDALKYRGAMEQFLSTHRRAYNYAANENEVRSDSLESQG